VAFKFHGVEPPIPIRYTFSGDIDGCRRLVGLARKRQFKLIESMGFQGLKTAKPPALDLGGGVLVGNSSSYGINNVRIHVPVGGNPPPKKIAECYCFCKVSVGLIIEAPAASTHIVNHEEVNDPLWVPQITDMYSVEVCNGETYDLYENITRTDLYPHYKDDTVLLVAQDREAVDPETDVLYEDIPECVWDLWRITSVSSGVIVPQKFPSGDCSNDPPLERCKTEIHNLGLCCHKAKILTIDCTLDTGSVTIEWVSDVPDRLVSRLTVDEAIYYTGMGLTNKTDEEPYITGFRNNPWMAFAPDNVVLVFEDMTQGTLTVIAHSKNHDDNDPMIMDGGGAEDFLPTHEGQTLDVYSSTSVVVARNGYARQVPSTTDTTWGPFERMFYSYSFTSPYVPTWTENLYTTMGFQQHADGELITIGTLWHDVFASSSSDDYKFYAIFRHDRSDARYWGQRPNHAHQTETQVLLGSVDDPVKYDILLWSLVQSVIQYNPYNNKFYVNLIEQNNTFIYGSTVLGRYNCNYTYAERSPNNAFNTILVFTETFNAIGVPIGFAAVKEYPTALPNTCAIESGVSHDGSGNYESFLDRSLDEYSLAVTNGDVDLHFKHVESYNCSTSSTKDTMSGEVLALSGGRVESGVSELYLTDIPLPVVKGWHHLAIDIHNLHDAEFTDYRIRTIRIIRIDLASRSIVYKMIDEEISGGNLVTSESLVFWSDGLEVEIDSAETISTAPSPAYDVCATNNYGPYSRTYYESHFLAGHTSTLHYNMILGGTELLPENGLTVSTDGRIKRIRIPKLSNPSAYWDVLIVDNKLVTKEYDPSTFTHMEIPTI